MKVSLQWLREFLPLEQAPAEIADLLTFAGIEVEGIVTTGVAIDKVVVGKILSSEQHPNADRLSVCRVEDGSGQPRQIVCGAKNYKVGDHVPVALPGAVLPGDFKIKVGKLRGETSEGMLCSAKELGISEESAGLLILPPDTIPGTPIGELYPSDTVFDLEITPNRPDLLSHRGIARDLAGILGVPLSNVLFGDDFRFGGVVMLPGGSAIVTSQSYIAGDAASKEEIADWMLERGVLSFPLPVRLENPAACPWYSVRVVRGVTVGPSPEWLRKKLQSVGLRSINNVVDVTNFVMLELGEPLHAFDLAKVDRGIVVRSAAEGEKFLALDGREYTLNSGDLMIADESRSLAIAGVMGGMESGVSATTTDVVLESALFSPAGIRRTSRRLGLFSDAAYRFERGVDPGVLLQASERACHLLEEVAGGTMDAQTAIAGQLPPLAWEVKFSHDRCRSLLGVAISDERIAQILAGLGLEKIGEYLWLVPSFRADLTREVDLIEEVSRVHGMDAIPSRVTAVPAPISEADRLYDFQWRLKNQLAATGFFEARTLSLRPENVTWEAAWRTAASLRVRNPLTEDQAIFRESLVPGLLAVAETNLRRGATSLRLLETGRVFRAGEREEMLMLGLLLGGESGPADWRQPVRTLDFFDLKAAVSSLLPEPAAFRPAALAPLILGAEVFVGETCLGWIGQVLPDLARSAGLRGAIFAAELDVSLLQKCSLSTPKYLPLMRFPAVTRDAALLAPAALTHGEIEATLLGAQEPLLEKVALFDVFADPTGEKIAAGQKSLAYSLTYRSGERTLTQEEVNQAHTRLKARLVEMGGVALRE